MTSKTETFRQDIVAKLALALTNNEIPDNARQTGESLLAHLKSPIRVGILGMPESGKSQLLNVLAGEMIVPVRRKLPDVRVEYGSKRQTILTARDKPEIIRQGYATDTAEATAAATITVRAPLPILDQLTLTERSTHQDNRPMDDQINWASENADMVIWCSQNFSKAEQKLWSRLPDSLKDHGFLALTKSDVLREEGTLNSRMEELEEVVAEEFHSMLPISSLEALYSMSEPDSAKREQAFIASGARAALRAITRHIDAGRRADIDNANFWLRRYSLSKIANTLSAEPDVAEAAPQPAAPAPKPAARVVSRPVVQLRTSDPVQPVLADQPVTGLEEDERRVIRLAADFLRDQAAPLTAAVSTGADNVLPLCAAAATEVSEMFLERDPSGDDFALLQDEISEAADMMLLFEHETGDGTVENAVSLLLQLRRELEVRLAA